ncbi:hypothetical protein GCM10028818_13860 [Spirosoma horti]
MEPREPFQPKQDKGKLSGGVSSMPARTQLTTKFGAPILDYSVMKAQKEGRFRTGRAKFGVVKSLQDWIKMFNQALQKGHKNDALKALNGLKETLIKDSKSKLKPPKKGTLSSNAPEEAQGFYKRWIEATEAHITHITTETNWLADLRSDYLNIDDLSGTFTRDVFLERIKVLEMRNVPVSCLACLWDYASPRLQKRIIKVLSFSEELKSVDGIDYFLEAITSGGLGSKLAEDLMHWTNGIEHYDVESYKISFDDWLKEKDKLELTVPYFNKEQREAYRLTIRDGKFYKANGEPITGNNIYVLSSDDVFYGGADGVKGLHHTSFMAGKPVKCAGHIITDSVGNLLEINTTSGHYAPSTANLMRAKVVLKKVMNVENVKFDNKFG